MFRHGNAGEMQCPRHGELNALRQTTDVAKPGHHLMGAGRPLSLSRNDDSGNRHRDSRLPEIKAYLGTLLRSRR
jgi:hypothetical protein